MVAWLIRLLSIATTCNAQSPLTNNDECPSRAPSAGERPFIIDDSTAVAELTRLCDKQSEAAKERLHRED
jgi:hypothetical protein